MFRNVNPVELARGQTVIVYARWLLVLAGLLVTVWNPDGLGQLRLQIGVVLAVAIGNFVMHAQLLRKRPTFQSVAFMASVGDLAMIALLVLSQGGVGSTTFVFFFPAVLAIAVAFPTEEAVLLSGIAAILEVVVSANSRDVDVTLVRAGALAATAVIGNAYWRLHRTNIVATANRAREAAQDLFWGQSATLWARWAMIAGGALLILSRADTTERLAIGVLPVVLLLISNFYLHGRYLLERPANAVLTLLATSLDLFAMVAMYFGIRAPVPAGARRRPGLPAAHLLGVHGRGTDNVRSANPDRLEPGSEDAGRPVDHHRRHGRAGQPLLAHRPPAATFYVWYYR
jgi:hypothetical protein